MLDPRLKMSRMTDFEILCGNSGIERGLMLLDALGPGAVFSGNQRSLRG